jgi:hypothetical protein
MGGPVISIALTEQLAEQERDALDAFFRRLEDGHFEHCEPGCWSLNPAPERLGITACDREGSRPFVVDVNGPGYEDGDYFEGGRYLESDWGFLSAPLGFIPVKPGFRLLK